MTATNGASALFGFQSAFSIFFGLGIIRMNLFSKTEK